VEALNDGVIGNAAFALEEISRPDTKLTKSALLGTTLRLGDTENYPDESFEIDVKVSKCTANARPKSWKKFTVRRKRDDPDDIVMKEPDDDDGERKLLFAQLSMHTKYVIEPPSTNEDDDESPDAPSKPEEPIEKEELIRGYKYGLSYAPCPDGTFPRLDTKKGIEICGVIDERTFRRDWAMGEIQFVWADPTSAHSQVALSSISQALFENMRMAIARWVSKNGADPKIGLLKAVVFDNTDCLLWIPVITKMLTQA
jgi:ATP-dependent DNA helicase 2 subunit 2